ncbi:MAG: FAD-dependent oxidoreductase, partial [Candidatus Muiribacteriaceae bacterium]
GPEKYQGGPHNQMPAMYLSESLKDIGIRLERFQTATPPRLKKSTIDFSSLKEIPADPENSRMSFYYRTQKSSQLSTWLAFTNSDTIREITAGLNRSPLVIKNITDKGPRYCPSIDRKVMNFPEKKKHQIFLEPEGFENEEIYVQGITSATPPDVQEKILRTVPGLEKCEIMRPGYGIEYDHIIPAQLEHTMQLRKIPGLYSAGQINGTSGYEEAAAQGIVAGINAALRALGRKPFIPSRRDSYIGVMIDDLISKEHYEPYRIFTSAAEFRLLLRQDNAVLRLSPLAYMIGTLSRHDFDIFRKYRFAIHKEKKRMDRFYIYPGRNTERLFEKMRLMPPKNRISALELIKRPELKYRDLEALGYSTIEDREVIENIEIETKYEGYIIRQKKEVRRIEKMEKAFIPDDIDYSELKGISNEAYENLCVYRPSTFGELKRLPGVSSHELNLLYIQIKNRSKGKK